MGSLGLLGGGGLGLLLTARLGLRGLEGSELGGAWFFGGLGVGECWGCGFQDCRRSVGLSGLGSVRV